MPLDRSAPSKWAMADMIAMQSLAPLVRDYVAWTAWSIRPAALASVINEIAEQQRKCVVELGSGTSTIFLGRALLRYGGSLVTIEHDAAWARYVERELALHGLANVVRLEVVPLAPFTPTHAAGTGWKRPTHWYATERLLSVVPTGIDLLLVDGPPAGEAPDVLVREPAAAVLMERFADDFSIALDDVDRHAEYETIHQWERLLGIEMVVIERISLAIGRSNPGFIPAF